MSFASDGFAVLARLLDASAVAMVRAQVDGLRSTRTVGTCERPNNVLVPLRWNDDAVGTVLHRPAVVARVAAACAGDDLRFTSGYLSLKEPHTGPLWWHQDWWCWDHPVTRSPVAPQVALLCYLDDATPTTGALRVLPGSHRVSTSLHRELPAVQSVPALPPDDHPSLTDHPDQVTVTAKAGDAVLIDYRLLHGTHPNAGPTRRECVILNFAPSWRSLPEDVRAHLIQGAALPRADDVVPVDVGAMLPRFDGARRDLVLTRDAPAVFAF